MPRSFTRRPFLLSFLLACTVGAYHPVMAATLDVPGPLYPTIQSAIDAASAGDTISVQAGRTYVENLVLKVKPAGSGYITIQSSALAALPEPDQRVGPADAVNMPTLQAADMNSPVISTELADGVPAHHYKLIGLEIARLPGAGIYHSLIMLESANQDTPDKVPHNFVIDRCYVHGLEGAQTRRGLYLGSRDTQILNSYFAQFHEHGADSQAILSVNGPGGYLIANNYLEAASENILFGGADPAIANLVPSDIHIERNYFHKPLVWRGLSPSWNVKNLLELKNARDVTIQYNIFENNWAEAQNGSAILFTVRNQDGAAHWSRIENVVFRYNVVKHTGNFLLLLTSDTAHPSGNLQNLEVSNNLVIITGSALGSAGKAIQFVRGPAGAVGANYVFNHNTFIHEENGQRFIQIEDGDTGFLPGLVIDNNIITTLEGATGGIFGGGSQGKFTLDYASPSWSFRNNAMRRRATLYPAESHYPGSFGHYRFKDAGAGDFRLRKNSPYYQAGTDGKDIGADIETLNRHIACVPDGNCTVSAQ